MTRRHPSLGVLLGGALVAACGQGASTRTVASHVRTTTGVAYYHATVAAGPSLITRDDGAVLDERRAEPFGAPIDGSFELDPHNALNKETDVATGWSDHGARWLAPETARWLTPDPPVKAPDPSFMLKPWALHPYQYVEQNPIAYWDPDGREPAEHPETTCYPEESADHGVIDDYVHKTHIIVTMTHLAATEKGSKLVGLTHAGEKMLHKVGTAASGVLAVGHGIAMVRSEPGTREFNEHAGATFTNAALFAIGVSGAPVIAGIIALGELFIPDFHEKVGRPAINLEQARAFYEQKRLENLQERLRQGPMSRIEGKIDSLNDRLDHALSLPPPDPEPDSATPTMLGPPEPEQMSRFEP